MIRFDLRPDDSRNVSAACTQSPPYSACSEYSAHRTIQTLAALEHNPHNPIASPRVGRRLLKRPSLGPLHPLRVSPALQGLISPSVALLWLLSGCHLRCCRIMFRTKNKAGFLPWQPLAFASLATPCIHFVVSTVPTVFACSYPLFDGLAAKIKKYVSRRGSHHNAAAPVVLPICLQTICTRPAC